MIEKPVRMKSSRKTSLKLKGLILYIRSYKLWKICFRMNMPGLGWVLRRIREPFTFFMEGKSYHFEPEVAAAYCLLPGGYWNEPETHRFFDLLMEKITTRLIFVDVGASIGEMVIDMAGRPQVQACVAFEPNGPCARAIEKSVQLNSFRNVRVVAKAVSDHAGIGRWEVDDRAPTRSSLIAGNAAIGTDVELTTLDQELADLAGPVLLLIDVEGAEPQVMRGGRSFIGKNLPLIVFEYNEVSRKLFRLEDISAVLPVGYAFYRLRSDGRVDQDFANTWNCVAVHPASDFAAILEALIVKP